MGRGRAARRAATLVARKAMCGWCMDVEAPWNAAHARGAAPSPPLLKHCAPDGVVEVNQAGLDAIPGAALEVSDEAKWKNWGPVV